MKFEFECELCRKQVKRGGMFSFDIFERLNDFESQGVECADKICKSCSAKIEKKIQSLKRTAK